MKFFIAATLVISLAMPWQPAKAGNEQNKSLALLQEEEIMEEAPKKKEVKKETPESEQEKLEEEKATTMEDAPPTGSEKMKYFKEKYEDDYDKPFEEVWAAVKKAIADINCMIQKDSYQQTDEGLFKGNIVSDFCVYSLGTDTTFSTLKKYSIKVPTIRGGVWENGRMQYKFVIKETANGKVHLLLKGEMSGFEQYVTYQVHFWDSNGYFEAMMMKRIRRNLGLPVN